MSIQSRIRSVVTVGLLLAAFFVFVPNRGLQNQDESGNEETVSSGVKPNDFADVRDPSSQSGLRLNWHGDVMGTPSVSNADSEIRPYFFQNSQAESNSLQPIEIMQANSISPHQRPLLPFQVQRPTQVDDLDLIPVEPKLTERSPSGGQESISHRIGLSDTLQSISIRYFGHPHEYLRIYELNQQLLDDPVRLPFGVVIEIPRH